MIKCSLFISLDLSAAAPGHGCGLAVSGHTDFENLSGKCSLQDPFPTPSPHPLPPWTCDSGQAVAPCLAMRAQVHIQSSPKAWRPSSQSPWILQRQEFPWPLCIHLVSPSSLWSSSPRCSHPSGAPLPGPELWPMPLWEHRGELLAFAQNVVF